MEGKASRMAQPESLKAGDDTERSEETPTRQFLSRTTGDPMPVASKMAAVTGGAGLARWCCIGEAAGAELVTGAAGFARGGALWAASTAAAQIAIQTAGRIFSRKTPPNVFFTVKERRGQREQGNEGLGP